MHAACVSPSLCALQEFCLRKHRTPLTKELLLLYLQVHKCLRSPGHDFADTTQTAVGTGRSARWGDSPPTSTGRCAGVTVHPHQRFVPCLSAQQLCLPNVFWFQTKAASIRQYLRDTSKSRVDLSKKQDHIRRSLLNSLLASQGIN